MVAEILLEHCAAVGRTRDPKTVEAVGFRYVIDVDLPEGAVSLTVAEPDWVTKVYMDLDHVPET